MPLFQFGPIAWLLFGAIVLAMLAIDLRGTAERHAGFRAAALRSTVWILVGLGFGLGIYVVAGPEAGFAYWAAYLLEKSLSVDNRELQRAGWTRARALTGGWTAWLMTDRPVEPRPDAL